MVKNRTATINYFECVIFLKVIHNFFLMKELIKTYLKPFVHNSLLIGLLLLILFHSEFYLIMFKGLEVKYKREIKQQIKNGISEENLVIFTFGKNIVNEQSENFRWMKKNEFRYKGEMYDIIKTEYKGDSIVYHVFHDLKESALFSNLDKHILDYLSSNREKGNELLSLTKNFCKYYLTPFTNNTQTINPKAENLNAQYSQNIILLSPRIFDPPPEV